jgi:hypothetical protein
MLMLLFLERLWIGSFESTVSVRITLRGANSCNCSSISDGVAMMSSSMYVLTPTTTCVKPTTGCKRNSGPPGKYSLGCAPKGIEYGDYLKDGGITKETAEYFGIVQVPGRVPRKSRRRQRASGDGATGHCGRGIFRLHGCVAVAQPARGRTHG